MRVDGLGTNAILFIYYETDPIYPVWNQKPAKNLPGCVLRSTPLRKIALYVSLNAKFRACVGKYRMTFARLPRQNEMNPCSAGIRRAQSMIPLYCCSFDICLEACWTWKEKREVVAINKCLLIKLIHHSQTQRKDLWYLSNRYYDIHTYMKWMNATLA